MVANNSRKIHDCTQSEKIESINIKVIQLETSGIYIKEELKQLAASLKLNNQLLFGGLVGLILNLVMLFFREESKWIN
jgi:hypothetical protein